MITDWSIAVSVCVCCSLGHVRIMCERPVLVAFIVVGDRVRTAVFAGFKHEFWLAGMLVLSRELRVYVTKLQKSKDGHFGSVHL